MRLLKLLFSSKRLFTSKPCKYIPNHYMTLQVPTYCSLRDIRVSYRRLAKKLHPDTKHRLNCDQQSHSEFAQINVAYSILSNPTLRRKYDQTLNLQKTEKCNASRWNTKTERRSAFNDDYETMNVKKRKNKRRSAGDIGSDRDMAWKQCDEDTYSVYWTDALDAWHLEHLIYLEQIDPWKRKTE